LAYCYEELEQYNEVIKALENALQFNPNSSDVYCDLGTAYSLLNQYALAISAYETATKLNPENKIGFWKLGLTYDYLYYISSNRSYQLKAYEAYKEVVRIDPNDSIGHYSLGLFYVRMGDLKAALEEYEVLKELDGEKARELYNKIYY
jgi:tetratricopeptide (TPR) repeat protein